MTLFTKTIGTKDEPVIIWAHGWGQDHRAFLPLAESLQNEGRHMLLDLPGFGSTPKPDTDWGTDDYAEAIAGWIRAQGFPPVIWAGHSFGCRVGIRLAARHPDLIKGMTLIAGAGLKRKRPPHQTLYFKARIYLYKFLKKLIPLGLSEEWLKSRFGSADYRNAGPMRAIFIKTVNEDLTETAKAVSCPVRLIYGEHDTETPPEFGNRYVALMQNARLFILKNQDHYSVLGGGRHPVAALLQEFIRELGA